jgi:UDP-N-acetylglucosamine acyltransferase
MSLAIHSTAVVSPGSILGENVKVEPFAVVEEGAQVGDNCLIESHAVIKKWARVAKNVRVGHFSVVGGDPQHLTFDRVTPSFVTIGNSTRLGESVTIHRSIYENKETKVGDEVFLMGNSHVAHDSILGDKTILANGVLLGGHVEIGDDVFIGGGSAIHQFVRIGSGAMIGGLAEISQDVGPNLLVSGRNHACGLNNVGLKRRNVENEDIKCLKQLYRKLLMSPVNVRKLAKENLEQQSKWDSKLVREFLEFFTTGERGFARFQKT